MIHKLLLWVLVYYMSNCIVVSWKGLSPSTCVVFLKKIYDRNLPTLYAKVGCIPRPTSESLWYNCRSARSSAMKAQCYFTICFIVLNKYLHVHEIFTRTRNIWLGPSSNTFHLVAFTMKHKIKTNYILLFLYQNCIFVPSIWSFLAYILKSTKYLP